MANDDDLLLRLLLKGLDPGQAESIANDAGNKFAGAMDGVNAKLLELHEQQSKLLLASDIKYSQQRIDEEIRKGKVIQGLMDEQEAAATKLANAQIKEAQRAAKEAAAAEKEHYNVTLANIAHLAEAAEGVKAGFESIIGGIEKLHDAAEYVNSVSMAYGSLKGSVAEASAAMHGQVTELTLIQERNRAAEKDLNLTDKEFAALAATAQHFAEVTGTDVKTALDKLIDGLATGRARLLAKAGVVVDATKANEEYAKSIGVNVDQLTQEDKLHALQIAALTKMKDKQKELGDESITFAQEFLREWNEIVNMINRGVAALGRFKLHEEDSLELAKRIDAQRAAAAQERGAAADAALEAAGADLNEGGQDVGLPGQIRTGLEGRGAMAGGPKRDKAGEAAAEKARRDRVFLDNILKGASGSGYASQGGPIGGDMTGYLMDKDTGEGGAQKLIADYEKIQKEMLAKQDSRLSAAGIKKGGLLSKLMFGESTDEHGDPSEDFIQKVKGTSDVALQLMADISQASQEMAHAAGASIEAAIGGAQSESLKRIVHDQLMALGTKYQIRALEFAAEGAGFLVYGDVPQAALAFEAAGLWEGAAVAAGLGARAVGTGGAGGNAGRPSTSSPAVNRGSGIPSSTIGTPANNNGQPQSIVINQTILPGGEAEAGRRVREALNADYSKTGMIPMGH